MKILKIIGLGFFLLSLGLIGMYSYLQSDFYEIRRIRNQIEKNLKIKISDLPKLIDREVYGWAEEGGDKVLLALSSQDCKIIVSSMKDVEEYSEGSEYFKIFTRNKVSPTFVKVWKHSNNIGDFVKYALDESTCYLYRGFHYE